MTESEMVVTDDVEQDRYVITVDGLVAGFAAYRRSGDAVVFTHTEVDRAFGGRGVGAALAKAALDSTRAAGRTAVPLCPFIASYISRHPDYADLVDPAHRGERPGT